MAWHRLHQAVLHLTLHLHTYILHTEFCNGEMGKYCDRLRVLRINESESLGPAMARYFSSKLYYGESYYLQIDSHSFFAEVGP